MNTYPMNPLTIGQANFNPYYNPMITNPVIPNYQPVTSPAPSRQIDCVNGKQSAYAFNIGPNSSVILADNLKPKIWVVTTDSSGYKAVKGYKIIEDDDEEDSPIVAEIKSEEPSVSESKWKETVENLTDRLNKLEEKVNEYRQSESDNRYADTSKSSNVSTQSNDRNSQSGKGSNGNYQSNGRK